MDTKELKKALSVIKPALGNADIVPQFEQILFNKAAGTATAFNSIVALRTEIAVPINGSVKGSLLLGMVDSLGDSGKLKVKQNKEKGTLNLKCGNTDIDLPLGDPNDYPFTFPDERTDAVDIPLHKDEMKGLQLCALSLLSDQTEQRYMGITALLDETLTLFSTDYETISRFEIEYEQPDDIHEPVRVILPTEFCKILASHAKGAGETVATLSLGEADVVAQLPGCELYSRLIDDSDPVDFDKTIDDVLDEADYDLITLPEAMSGALSRAALLGDECTLEIKAGEVWVRAQSDFGRVDESMSIIGDHPDVTVHTDPRLLLRVMDYVTKGAVLESCIILVDDDAKFRHFIATS